MRVFFTNLGCKLNQAENDRLAGEMLAAGHQLAATLAEADLHVVNSCTVTAGAARSSRKAARAAARARSGAPAAGEPTRTVLTGCYATASPAEAAGLAGVDLVVANADKDRLVERVHAAFPALRPAGAVAPVASAATAVPPPSPGNTRALLKVEDGCDMHCSFCIIPLTRGRHRSRLAAELVSEAGAWIAAGYREIVVTGVQISAWRDGAPPRTGRHGGAGGGLAHLVRRLLAALPASPLAARLRLTSIAPWELSSELLDLWRDPRLCRHLHLSLQSGATATLRRMRRPYSAAAYARQVAAVRAAVPGVAITTDVIVGFPGESAADFEESLATVAGLGFAKVHVFPFSARPGTAAAALPDAVPEAELRDRMARMLAVAARAEAEFRTAHLGRRATVLWEGPRHGQAQGLTDNYLRVFAPQAAADRLWNQLVEVEVTGLVDGGVSCRLP